MVEYPNDPRMNSEFTFSNCESPYRQNDSVLIDMPPPVSSRTPASCLESGFSAEQVANRTDPPIYILPPMASDKVTLRKFSGYSHEDPERFLSEFESYVTFSGLNFDPNTARKVAAFHIHLSGPALTWFHSLDSSVKQDWPSLMGAFTVQYLVRDHLDPTIMAESSAYHKLKLLPGQPLEDFHAQIMEKGKRLDKPERDMLYQFTEGLPPTLAFFVRAGMCTTLKGAFVSAKSAEAAGYRSHGSQIPTFDPRVNAISPAGDHESTAIADLQTQMSQLVTIVKGMQNFSSPCPVPSTNDRQSRAQSSFHCYKCQGPDHRKRDCLWTGDGERTPNVCCQICGQYGHSATQCKKFPAGTTQSMPTVQSIDFSRQSNGYPYPPPQNQTFAYPPSQNQTFAPNNHQGNAYFPRDVGRGLSGGQM